LRACTSCRLMRYPPSHGCPWCMSLEWEWQEVSGKGHIYSYEVVHHAIQPGFKEWTPYAVVLVELDEQRGTPTPDEALRIIGNLRPPAFRPGAEGRVAIGRPVRVVSQALAPVFPCPHSPPIAGPPVGRVGSLPA